MFIAASDAGFHCVFITFAPGEQCECYAFGLSVCLYRRRYTMRSARTELADCHVNESIVKCDMSL